MAYDSQFRPSESDGSYACNPEKSDSIFFCDFNLAISIKFGTINAERYQLLVLFGW